MLLKEIFKKMYASNKERINKLEFFMTENKKRIKRSEDRIDKYPSPPPHPSLLPHTIISSHFFPSKAKTVVCWVCEKRGRGVRVSKQQPGESDADNGSRVGHTQRGDISGDE